MLIEPLESRCLLNAADALFSRDVGEASARKNLHAEQIDAPPLGQRVIGLSSTNPPTIRHQKKGSSVLVVDSKDKNVTIRNVGLESHSSMPAIRVGGKNTYIGNVSVSKASGSAIIVDGAKKTLIENCNQNKVTQNGFVYCADFTNLTIRNVSTSGNYYENELVLQRI